MKSNFGELVQSDTPTLIDFYAEWCGPCKAQAPILKQFAQAQSGNVRVIKIDIDKNNEIAQKLQIRSVPTLMLFRNGESKWRKSGVADLTELNQVLLTNA